jgi:O-antigen/teichoic acid export membrane protein
MKQTASTRPLIGIVLKLAADIVARLFQLGLIVLSARMLGTQSFGVYSIAIFYGFLFNQLSDFGLHLLTTREASKSLKSENTAEQLALTAKGWLSGSLILLSVLVAFLYGKNFTEFLAFFLICSSFVVYSIAEFCFSLFRAWGKLRLEAILVFGNRGGLLILGGLALVLGFGLTGLAVAHLVSAGIVALIALRWTRPYAVWQGSKFRAVIALYGKAFPLGLGLLLSLLAFRIDIPLLYALQNEAVVGIYNAAYRLFEPALLVPAAILAGTFPNIVREVEAKGSTSDLETAKVILWSLHLLGVLGGLTLGLLASPLVSLLYGADYISSADVLVRLSLVIPFIFVNYGLTHLLIAKQREKWNTAFFGIALAVNVLANLLLIPAFGANGAALATLLTEITLWLCCSSGLWYLRTR